VKKAAARRHLAALVTVALASGCGRPDRQPAPPGSGRALPGAALRFAPRFQPPADGLVTGEQVEQFIRVRRAAKGRTDAETAQALGLLPEEIAWTRARIVEALVALDERRVREASSDVYAKALASMKSARSETRAREDARVLDEQIAALERERGAVRREETPPSALASNMRRVSSRRAELEAIAP
jgi:hypothetical protein